MTDNIRAFFAIEIPNLHTLEQISLFQNDLQKALGPLKLVDKELMHITLRFLGNISQKQASELAMFTDMEVNKKFFPNNRIVKGKLKGVDDFRKNVFYIKIDGVTELLTEIFHFINNKLHEYPNIQEDRNTFTPHLTIARSKRNRRRGKNDQNFKNSGQLSYGEIKEKYRNFEFGEWSIQKVILKRSQLTPSGPIYTDLSGKMEKEKNLV